MQFPVRTAAPAETPISVAEAKAHLRVGHTDEDALIGALVDAATAHLDGHAGILGRALVTQTWRLDFPAFPASARLRLPLFPAVSITSVTYYDTANAQQTLATSIYAGPFLDEGGAYIILKTGQSWPATYDREDAVSVTYVAGYGAATAVPAPIKAAMLLMVGHLYEHREAVLVGDAAMPLPMAVESLLNPFRQIAK